MKRGSDANKDRLARYGGIYPIGTLFGKVELAGRTWDLYTGYNGQMRVYSFLPPSGDIRDFSCDIKDFYNYLEKAHAFPAKEQNIIGELLCRGTRGGAPLSFRRSPSTTHLLHTHLILHALFIVTC